MPTITKEINAIRAKVALMCDLMSNMFNHSILALRKQDQALARQVIGRDSQVDELETELEDLCLRFLARFAPKASELRYVVAVTRLVSDLERIADHATVICREVLAHHLAPIVASLPKLSQMTDLTSNLVERSVTALFALDDAAYLQIGAEDHLVGDLQSELNSQLISKLSTDHDSALEIVSIVNVIRRVERVADHSKNIAVMIPYITRGELLRHRPETPSDDDTHD
ncbi:MAG: phosphate signaling complex protein PhoU [Deltaproteobacteria bacterium]|jgi:phosphate transport system protein|nr:phosphate signaling complex protein PhoU [Deltaproteobacteria bacterium]